MKIISMILARSRRRRRSKVISNRWRLSSQVSSSLHKKCVFGNNFEKIFFCIRKLFSYALRPSRPYSTIAGSEQLPRKGLMVRTIGVRRIDVRRWIHGDITVVVSSCPPHRRDHLDRSRRQKDYRLALAGGASSPRREGSLSSTTIRVCIP